MVGRWTQVGRLVLAAYTKTHHTTPPPATNTHPPIPPSPPARPHLHVRVAGLLKQRHEVRLDRLGAVHRRLGAHLQAPHLRWAVVGGSSGSGDKRRWRVGGGGRGEAVAAATGGWGEAQQRRGRGEGRALAAAAEGCHRCYYHCCRCCCPSEILLQLHIAAHSSAPQRTSNGEMPCLSSSCWVTVSAMDTGSSRSPGGGRGAQGGAGGCESCCGGRGLACRSPPAPPPSRSPCRSCWPATPVPQLPPPPRRHPP